ncbi:MAG: glycosyltransferase family 39 protein [Deltaproteobacteria bacterium]|nr:glycosyltransferase family 39 protein [Deltaproteobacteria bacterium]
MLVPLGLAALTLGLCTSSLQHWPLSADESFTWRVARAPLDEVLRLVAADVHPPLYFLLAWVSAHLGDSDACLRLPSALAAAVAVACLARVGAWGMGERIGSLSAGLLAASPFLLALGTLARPYACLVALGAGALAAGMNLALGSHLRRAGALLAGIGIVGSLFHLVFPVVVAAVALGVATTDRRRALVAFTACALSAGVALVWLVGPGAGQIEHAGGVRLGAPVPAVLLYLLWPIGRWVHPASWLLTGLGVIGFGVALVRRTPTDRVLLGILGGGLALPLAASVLSGLTSRHNVWGALLPLACVLAAVGLDAMLRALRLGARPALLAGIVLPWGVAVPVFGVLHRLPSAPYGPVETGAGTHDVRQDVAVLERIAPDGAPLDWAAVPVADRYLRYGMDTARPRDASPVSVWPVTRNEPLDEVHWSSLVARPVGERCVLTHALPITVTVRDPEACARIDRALGEARWDAYGPVLHERAERAFYAGDLEAARRAAASAAAASALDTRPAILWARLELAAGNRAGALVAIERGLALARRWGDREAARILYALRHQALRGAR